MLILGVASQCHQVIYPSLFIETKRRKDGVQLIREPRKTNHCFTARKRYFTGNLSFNVGHDIFGSVTIGSLIHVPHKEVKWTLSDQRNSWTNTSTFYDFSSNHLDKLILELVFKGNILSYNYNQLKLSMVHDVLFGWNLTLSNWHGSSFNTQNPGQNSRFFVSKLDDFLKFQFSEIRSFKIFLTTIMKTVSAEFQLNV